MLTLNTRSSFATGVFMPGWYKYAARGRSTALCPLDSRFLEERPVGPARMEKVASSGDFNPKCL
jgi:hypothetical protein